MPQITITEALAEIKTNAARRDKKKEAILRYLTRPGNQTDPMVKDGGSADFINREMQSIKDLGERLIVLRRLIATANQDTTITINGTTRSIADWLTYRREVADKRQDLLGNITTALVNTRAIAARQGGTVINVNANPQPPAGNDVIVNVDEGKLSKEIEDIETILGQLDGQLSLKNATTLLTYE